MCRWRKRIGDAGAEQLLKETIEAGLKLKAVKSFQLKRVNVDTTVQEKEVRFPTAARLYDRARQRLVNAAKKRSIILRQNYNRKAKQLLAQQSRYAHARQMKRSKKCTRTLRTYLGRVIRDIGLPPVLEPLINLDSGASFVAFSNRYTGPIPKMSGRTFLGEKEPIKE